MWSVSLEIERWLINEIAAMATLLIFFKSSIKCMQELSFKSRKSSFCRGFRFFMISLFYTLMVSGTGSILSACRDYFGFLVKCNMHLQCLLNRFYLLNVSFCVEFNLKVNKEKLILYFFGHNIHKYRVKRNLLDPVVSFPSDLSKYAYHSCLIYAL